MAKRKTSKFFNQTEAKNKIGKHIRALIELPGVPRGAEGVVVNVNEVIQGNAQYRLMIEWNIPARVLPFNSQVLAAIAGGYDLASIGKPTRQQFNKEEYERCLWEIDPPR